MNFEDRKKDWQGKSKDSWERTKEKMSNYDSFINDIEKRLGRKLVYTTAGGPKSQHTISKEGALDIAKSQISDKEYSMIAKVALEYGYRVGDEADHLHIDSRPRNEGTKRVFYNIPSEAKISQLENKIKSEKNIDKKNRLITKKTNLVNQKEARTTRKNLGEFDKYETDRKNLQTTINTNMPTIVAKAKSNLDNKQMETKKFLDSGSTGLREKISTIDDRLDENKELRLEVVKRQLQR